MLAAVLHHLVSSTYYIYRYCVILFITIKLFIMKKTIAAYVFGVTLLGAFSGILMSMGHNILASIGFMCLFWALMLTPMLGD